MRYPLTVEIGRTPGPRYVPDTNGPLTLPVFAEKSPDGTCLVVDELDYCKPVSDMILTRLLCIDPMGDLLFDSVQQGLADAIGCFLDDGRIAVISRLRRELAILTAYRVREHPLSLNTTSKWLPRDVVSTDRGTLLLTFRGIRIGQWDVAEMDFEGRVLWYLPDTGIRLGRPRATQILANDHILLVDIFYHVALELDRDGQVIWQWGRWDSPDSGLDHLASPRSVICMPDGRRLIVDTHNNRLLMIDAEGRVEIVESGDGGFCGPRHAALLHNGHVLVCDSANARVVELDQTLHVTWHYGNATGGSPSLLFPRSVDRHTDGRLLIADTLNDRIMQYGDAGLEVFPLEKEIRLSWPRCARWQHHGGLLICDGRNSRVLEVAEDGTLLQALQMPESEQSPSADPHDIRLLENDRLLITAAAQQRVIEIDWQGHIHWSSEYCAGLTLSDPHSAQLTETGSLLVCDTGNHRIVTIDRDKNTAVAMREFVWGCGLCRLHAPRYAEMTPYGLLIVDTGNYRVLLLDKQFTLRHVVAGSTDSRIPYLREPRWAQWVDEHRLLVSDYFNHRILEVDLSSGR